MPRLMEKQDWMQTVADVGTAKGIWYENVVGDVRDVSFALPEAGRYRVILVKLDESSARPSAAHFSDKRKISPRVRALRGAAKLNDSRDYKEILADALAEKYEAAR